MERLGQHMADMDRELPERIIFTREEQQQIISKSSLSVYIAKTCLEGLRLHCASPHLSFIQLRVVEVTERNWRCEQKRRTEHEEGSDYKSEGDGTCTLYDKHNHQ